ncbi:anhydrase [Arthrobacter sp. RIT-PI-e]|uniref:gamma carbonic anhydrase family protein n=1 Tax=Arthrobacter sp. RIT-PI-e TaxID=1681197 RepID=UPI000675E67C|nr:gamma carbonic anhydrase family protein [Arthrobacter sp. RIT-PI-e]KNC19689.1 anhydrase [Arthrobacter sp. RIT-PI-e]
MSHIIPFRGTTPRVGVSAFVAPTATLIGEVSLGAFASVFYGASVRADTAAISIGEGTNLQDNVVVHADPGYPASIGDRVSVGHGAVVHGCTVEDDCLIGMGATVMNGAVIGAGSLVAAGAGGLEGAGVPPRSPVAGGPAKGRRGLDDDEVAAVRSNAGRYRSRAQEHRDAVGGGPG